MICHLPLVFPLAGLLLFAFLPLPVALGVYLPLAGLSAEELSGLTALVRTLSR